MNSYRYFLPAAVASLAVGLLACAQPAVELSPSIEPPEKSIVVQSPANSIEETTAQSPVPGSELKERDTIDACFNMVAYDPADTSVNLRDRPDGRIIDQLPNLSLLQREGPAGAVPGWNYVFVLDTSTWGYVWGDLIYLARYQVQDPQDTFANMRRSPNGEVITAVPNGTEVHFIGTDGSWTKVLLDNGQEGYISTDRLDRPNCF